MADFRSIIPFRRAGLARGGYDPFTGFREEMDRLLEDFGRGLPAAMTSEKGGFLVPKVDVAETGAGLELTAELPGFDEKDVTLDIHDGVLTIKASTRTSARRRTRTSITTSSSVAREPSCAGSRCRSRPMPTRPRRISTRGC